MQMYGNMWFSAASFSLFLLPSHWSFVMCMCMLNRVKLGKLKQHIRSSQVVSQVSYVKIVVVQVRGELVLQKITKHLILQNYIFNYLIKDFYMTSKSACLSARQIMHKPMDNKRMIQKKKCWEFPHNHIHSIVKVLCQSQGLPLIFLITWKIGWEAADHNKHPVWMQQG